MGEGFDCDVEHVVKMLSVSGLQGSVRFMSCLSADVSDVMSACGNCEDTGDARLAGFEVCIR